MINWYWIMAIAVALALFLFYKEWTRKRKNFLYGRLVASLLAVSSLLFMAYPFADGNKETSGKIVLLTSGFVKDTVDNFLINSKSAAVYTETNNNDYRGKKAKLVADWRSFITKHAADTFHVFGNGFSSETLAMFNGHPIIFHAPPATESISDIYWKQHLEEGEPLLVQGSYENNSNKKVKIVLKAFGADKDSVSVAAGTHRDFQLRTIPVHTGTAVYSLITVSGNDTLEKEPLPVEVKPTAPLQLLIISSSPDFDNTYLKNHLSQQGYKVTIATTVSTNKTDKQFLNMPSQQTGSTLNTAYLSKFDVLMTDQEALQKISAAELAAVRSAVADKGIGLVIKMDAENKQAFYSRFFPVKVLDKDKESLLQLRNVIADSSSFKLKVSNPVSIGYTPGTQTILKDAQSNIYAAGTLYGNGKIIATTLQNTYSMALAGNKIAYQQLWWLLLNKAAKKIERGEVWQTSPFNAKLNQPVQMQVESTESNQLSATIDKTNIYLTQDKLLPFIWKGTYWPEKTGWLQFPQLSEAGSGWYVYGTSDWRQLDDNKNKAATKKYAAEHSIIVKDEKDTAPHLPANTRLWLFFLFLAACIFLWVEQKTG